MGKYAVVIGINYVNNPEAALEGCCNDARLMLEMLSTKGFDPDNIRVLVDDDDSYPTPNHVNVKNALNWLCSDREEGDVVFLHYSGHGTQVPADDDDVEHDNLDEAIVLDELYLMADDDLKQFFAMLPPGVHATVVTDCCHSGTMLDGTEIMIEGSKDEYSSAPQAESEALMETLGGSRGVDVSASRFLPVDVICSVMSQKTGHEVPPTSSGINGAMASLFGGTAGKFMLKFAMSQLAKQGGQDGGGGSDMVNMLTGLMGMAGPGEPDPHSTSSGKGMGSFISSVMGGSGGGSGGSGGLGGLVSSFLGGGNDSEPSYSPSSQPGSNPSSALGSLMSNIGLQGSPGYASSEAPPYNPQHKPISEDVCVLITGCQSHETSADVRPPNGDAYGALTKTLTDVVKENPDINYYDLVTKVRQVLSAGNFAQNPCLETSENRAYDIFVCES